MNILFVHPLFPGQFGPLARHLASTSEHCVKALCTGAPDGRGDPVIDGLEMVIYGADVVPGRPRDDVLAGTDDFIRHAASLAIAAERLKASGFYPDVVYCHVSWGPGAFLHLVFPQARYIKYCEWFYNETGGDADFLPEHRELGDGISGALLNLPILSEMARADHLIAPTGWQKSQFPEPIRPAIEIIADGIDMDFFSPDAQAVFPLANGRILTSGDPVVTYVARGADPYRGFSTFMKALGELQSSNSEVIALIAGDRKVHYGAGAGTEAHFHEVMSRVRVDPLRTHFLGHVDLETYRRLLRVSTVHVYLTVPFVLSWSMLEAMATGCLVIGSSTPPVLEFLRDGENGLTCNFFDHARLAQLMQAALDNRQTMDGLRTRARATIDAHWSTRQAFARHKALLTGCKAGLAPLP